MKSKEAFGLPKVPKSWEIKELREIGEIVTGSTPKTSESSYWNGDVSFVTPSDIDNNKFVKGTERMVVKEIINPSRLIPKNSILYTSIASIGKIAISSEECTTNQQINSIVPNNNVVADYLYYSLLYRTNYIKTLAGSTTVPIINKSLFSSIKVALPKLTEQQKIASILSSVDEAIEKTNQIIEQTEKIKYSIVQKLLTKGIKNNYFKSTSYGEIPTNWDIKSLDEISEHIFVGIATSTTNSYADKGVPIIRNQNIQENWLDTENMLYINEEFSEKNKKKKLKSGDVLTVRTGYPGITCVVPDKYQGAHTFTTLVSRPIQSIINPYFLSWFINSQVGKKFVDSGKAGGAQQNLNVSTLKKMSIFVPPLTEQNSIVRRLNSIEDKINNEKKHNDKLKSLKQGLMQQLLTGKVRVPTTESEEVPQ